MMAQDLIPDVTNWFGRHNYPELYNSKNSQGIILKSGEGVGISGAKSGALFPNGYAYYDIHVTFTVTDPPESNSAYLG
jgi:hypothetical protein